LIDKLCRGVHMPYLITNVVIVRQHQTIGLPAPGQWQGA